MAAQVTDSPNKRMSGKELRRLRVAAGLSKPELAKKVGTYRKQIQRWETTAFFELHPTRMKDMLNALGVART